MVKKGKTKKQAEAYWKSKEAASAESDSGTLDPVLSDGDDPLFVETTKEDLLRTDVNNLQPDANRLLPSIRKNKGYNQIGGGTPIPELSPVAFVPKTPGKIPFSNVAKDLDHLFLSAGLVVLVAALSTLLLLSGGPETFVWVLGLLGLFVGEWRTINAPRVLPDDVDFVVYSNEDYGFTSALTDAAAIFAFSMPYPAGMNLFEETIEAYQIDFIAGQQVAADSLIGRGMQVWMSMLDKEFTAGWTGIPTDAEDENIKAHFEGPMYMGNRVVTIPGSGETTGYEVTVDSNIHLRWYPVMKKLRLTTPLFVQFKGISATVTLATRAIAVTGDYALHETNPLRMFYRVVKLSTAEKGLRSAQLRWQILNS